MQTRGGIFIRNPYIRYFTDDGAAGAGGDGTGDDENAPKFPANTPVKDMKPEEQAAYHLPQSRKHENRAKSFGEWTPEKIRQLEQERDNLRAKGQTDSEKELDKVREEGRVEVRAELNRVTATHALEKALAGRTADPSALLGLNVAAKFVVNGQVDQDAIAAWVEANSAATTTQQKKNPDLGNGNRGNAGGAGKSVSSGRDLYADRHKKSSN